MCNHVMGDGTVITDCGYCGCSGSPTAHTPATDDEGRSYCGICHQWL